MLSEKIFLRALKGGKTERIPFWFMRQAGRYLPEYRALRAQKGGFLEMAMDPVCACEITLQPIRRFGMDAAILFSDILVVPMALGMDLRFAEGEGPKLDALESFADLARLGYGGFDRLDSVYEAIVNIRKALVDEGLNETALIGFSGAPWTVATYMIEGGSSRDFMKTKVMAYSDPEGFQALIDLLTQATARYLIAQIRAGAEAVQVFDSWAGALDAQGFGRWCVDPMRKIVDEIRAVFPDVPIIGFAKGAGANIVSYANHSGASALGLDQHVDTRWAAQTLQTLMPVQGNLDPFCLLAGGASLTQAVERICADLSNGSFVFNLGHGIHKDTPLEHVQSMIGAIRAHG
jgi:uroporphyrinogen decarboxylase